MPDVTIRNDTESTINIAFGILTPLVFTNEVKPGDTVRLNLAMFVHSVEARVDNGTNRFSSGESWARVSDIGSAVAAGTAAVTLGTAWVCGAFGPHASPLATGAIGGAGLSWKAATDGGKRFEKIPYQAAGVIVVATGVWVPWYEMTYSIRKISVEETDRYVLWDDNKAEKVGNYVWNS
ncbi:hypothetical protein HGRIS_010510 [Hohenbuehelia grisea]|uniref:Uncharacterized protein n=1 Tax=Hohenbuehelia grisea TaxID=104357 RepID=A0ABR3IXN6_9AGAR